MRGLATSFWLAAPYFAGWAASTWENPCFRPVAVAGIFAALFIAIISSGILVFASPRYEHRFAVDVFTFVSLAISLFCLGVMFGGYQTPSHEQSVALAVVAVASLFAGARCFRGYKFYAEQFAQAIWRDFAGLRMTPSSEAKVSKSSGTSS
jgi:hypothetical protein